MGFFVGSTESMLRELRELRKEVTLLAGERDAMKKERGYQQEALDLREKIETLKIAKGRIEEEQARREREVRHEVGLLRTQVEAEQEIATKQAVLQVREENLGADRKRFEEQMKFTTGRFEKEVKYLHDIAGQMLRRLPVVTVDRRITEGVAANGKHSEEED